MWAGGLVLSWMSRGWEDVSVGRRPDYQLDEQRLGGCVSVWAGGLIISWMSRGWEDVSVGRWPSSQLDEQRLGGCECGQEA